MKAHRLWTPEEVQLVADRYTHTHTQELADMLGRPVDSVYRKAYSLGLKKDPAYLTIAKPGHDNLIKHGLAGRFVKGQVSWNKGKKCPGLGGATTFKKGNRPHTEMPVGSYRVRSDGYVEFKFSDLPGPYTNRWITVHRKVWTEANGPVPPGHVIVFKPGMKTTEPHLITPERLELITYAENMRRNTFHRYGPEVAQLVQLRGAITRQINKRQKAEETHE